MVDEAWNWVSPSGLIVAEGTTFSIEAEQLSDARLAMSELKFLKRDLQLEKKMVVANLKILRTSRSQQIARQGSMTRGGSQFGQIVRTFERMGRDHDRSKHVNRLAPFQQTIAVLDDRIMQVDKVITTLDRHIHSLKAAKQVAKSNRQRIVPPALPVCPSCGNTEDIGAQFCGTCGSRL
jgi:hypothetical protein